MIFGAEDTQSVLYGTSAVGILAAALVYLVKRHEERLDKKDHAHQERMRLKDEDCSQERREHREERQEEAAMNREVMKAVTTAINGLTAQLNYRSPNRNHNLPQG